LILLIFKYDWNDRIRNLEKSLNHCNVAKIFVRESLSLGYGIKGKIFEHQEEHLKCWELIAKADSKVTSKFESFSSDTEDKV
jgi:hypothetical protein